GRRRGVAQRARGRRPRSDPTGQAWARQSLALADGPDPTQASKARGRGACQQDGAHRLEADGQRRTLRPAARGERLRPAERQSSAGRAPSRPRCAAFGGGLRPALTALAARRSQSAAIGKTKAWSLETEVPEMIPVSS